MREGVLGVYRLAEDKFENVTVQLREGATLPRSRYLVAYVKRAEDSPWYAGKCYVDLLYPGVTEKFLDITLEAYRREVGEQFGKLIPGVFTDEPQLRPSGGLPWTDHIPAEFKRRWGYSLIECLPSLTKPVGDWKRVRHNYYQVILEQFIEHWGKPYFEYCQQHGLELTGHYWEHEWPNANGVPYECAFEVAAPQGQYYVRLLDWYGSVAKIMVNGKLAGYIGYRPWRRNVTKWMQPGSNTIEVVVIGTLKNTLGPHHASSVLGTMGPHHFEIAPEQGPPPGADYCTVGYGLRKPFVLEQAMR